MDIYSGTSDLNFKINVLTHKGTGNNNCGLDCLSSFGIIDSSQYRQIRKVLKKESGMLDFEDLVKICNSHRHKINLLCVSDIKDNNIRFSFNNSKYLLCILHSSNHYTPIKLDISELYDSCKKLSHPEFNKILYKLRKCF